MTGNTFVVQGQISVVTAVRGCVNIGPRDSENRFVTILTRNSDLGTLKTLIGAVPAKSKNF